MANTCRLSCGFCSACVDEMSCVDCVDSTNCTVCADTDAQCSNWAALGYCGQDHGYGKHMAQACPVSCGYCPVCTDQHYDCARWATNGNCNGSEYMNNTCPLSCGLCKADECDESSWPDVAVDRVRSTPVVCSDCKVLVDDFEDTYKTCRSYCGWLGLECVGAW